MELGVELRLILPGGRLLRIGGARREQHAEEQQRRRREPKRPHPAQAAARTASLLAPLPHHRRSPSPTTGQQCPLAPLPVAHASMLICYSLVNPFARSGE